MFAVYCNSAVKKVWLKNEIIHEKTKKTGGNGGGKTKNVKKAYE